MKGFFSKDQTRSKTRPDGSRSYTCASCGLYRYVLSPKMEPYGEFKKGILNVGEAPGGTEDRRGKQWQGKAGNTLKRAYKKLGIDLFDDCLNINSINCFPTDDKGKIVAPTSYQIACCRHVKVLPTITRNKPKVIIALGTPALESLIGHRWQGEDGLGGITRWRGLAIPDREYNAWICPVFHPSYVMRKDSPEVDTIWMQDLERAISMIDVPIPQFEDERQYVTYLDSPQQLPPFPDVVAFDYETTGLKPQAEGHRIVCASVAYNEKEVYTFMMPKKKSERRRFIKMLRTKSVHKIAHNMKYEHNWSIERLKTPVKRWLWDSMLAAHVIDNRKRFCGLKFQVYINFGEIDYDSDISWYLKAKQKKNGNAFNRVPKLIKTAGGRKQLLTYCALDSLFEYRLAMKQMKQLGKEVNIK